MHIQFSVSCKFIYTGRNIYVSCGAMLFQVAWLLILSSKAGEIIWES